MVVPSKAPQKGPSRRLFNPKAAIRFWRMRLLLLVFSGRFGVFLTVPASVSADPLRLGLRRGGTPSLTVRMARGCLQTLMVRRLLRRHLLLASTKRPNIHRELTDNWLAQIDCDDNFVNLIHDTNGQTLNAFSLATNSKRSLLLTQISWPINGDVDLHSALQ